MGTVQNFLVLLATLLRALARNYKGTLDIESPCALYRLCAWPCLSGLTVIATLYSVGLIHSKCVSKHSSNNSFKFVAMHHTGKVRPAHRDDHRLFVLCLSEI